ncbi:neurotrypsin, partial [Elysia marginata]
YPPDRSFCLQGDTDGQVYPIYQHLDLIQVNGKDRAKAFVGKGCERKFTTDKDMRLTLHFLIMERDPEVMGSFTIKDGGRPLQTVKIDNGTFPESVTTTSNQLGIKLEVTSMCTAVMLSLFTT